MSHDAYMLTGETVSDEYHGKVGYAIIDPLPDEAETYGVDASSARFADAADARLFGYTSERQVPPCDVVNGHDRRTRLSSEGAGPRGRLPPAPRASTSDQRSRLIGGEIAVSGSL